MEVVTRILDLTGASPDLVRHVADRPGHDRRYAVDSSKLRGLGWTPAHSFDAGGLEETVEWYRANREWWEPIKSGEYRRYYDTQYAAGSASSAAPRAAGMPPQATNSPSAADLGMEMFRKGLRAGGRPRLPCAAWVAVSRSRCRLCCSSLAGLARGAPGGRGRSVRRATPSDHDRRGDDDR